MLVVMLSDNCQSVNKVLLDAELLSPRHRTKIKRTILKTYVKVCRKAQNGDSHSTSFMLLRQCTAVVR